MAESNDMERKQKLERDVKDYLEAMDKIHHDLVKMIEMNTQRYIRTVFSNDLWNILHWGYYLRIGKYLRIVFS